MAYEIFATAEADPHTVEIRDGKMYFSFDLMEAASKTRSFEATWKTHVLLYVDREAQAVAVKFKAHNQALEILASDDRGVITLPKQFSELTWLRPGTYAAKRNQAHLWELTRID